MTIYVTLTNTYHYLTFLRYCLWT